MKTELNTIVRGFYADVQAEVLQHRTIDGAGVVASFEANVHRHKERALSKLNNIRTTTPAGVDKASSAIGAFCESEIARVKAAGEVEFAGEVL